VFETEETQVESIPIFKNKESLIMHANKVTLQTEEKRQNRKCAERKPRSSKKSAREETQTNDHCKFPGPR